MNENQMKNEHDKVNEKEKVIRLLAYHGIHEYVEIEEEAVGMLIAALTGEDIVNVKLNGEGGIVIEYDDSNLIG